MTEIKNARDRPDVDPVWDQNTPARDEGNSSGTSGRVAGITGTDWLLYGVVAVVALGIGIVNALSIAQDAVRRGDAYDLTSPLLWEMSSVVSILVVAPVLFYAIRRIRNAPGWLVRGAVAAAAIIVFSTLHIAGMVGIRKTAMFLANGSYDFHFSLGTLLYEFRKDVITCVMIGGALWLVGSRREAQGYRAPPTKAGRPELRPAAPHMVWLRDGSTRIRIEPTDILWIGSAGNYVEYTLAGGISHLVRGTLAAEEARLKNFNVVRIHRTKLVNLSRVSGVRAGPNGDFELTLDTGQTIGGSRRYRQAVASIDAVFRNSPVDNVTSS